MMLSIIIYIADSTTRATGKGILKMTLYCYIRVPTILQRVTYFSLSLAVLSRRIKITHLTWLLKELAGAADVELSELMPEESSICVHCLLRFRIENTISFCNHMCKPSKPKCLTVIH